MDQPPLLLSRCPPAETRAHPGKKISPPPTLYLPRATHVQRPVAAPLDGPRRGVGTRTGPVAPQLQRGKLDMLDDLQALDHEPLRHAIDLGQHVSPFMWWTSRTRSPSSLSSSSEY